MFVIVSVSYLCSENSNIVEYVSQYHMAREVMRKIFSIHTVAIWFNIIEVATMDYFGCEWMARQHMHCIMHKVKCTMANAESLVVELRNVESCCMSAFECCCPCSVLLLRDKYGSLPSVSIVYKLPAI